MRDSILDRLSDAPWGCCRVECEFGRAGAKGLPYSPGNPGSAGDADPAAVASAQRLGAAPLPARHMQDAKAGGAP
jgi:hypothetical protein